MNETLKRNRGWRIGRRILMGVAILATLIAIFYTEEDWRGKRAWENCKRELETKGAVLDWNQYIPPPVPEDQNFFSAPKMQEWFVKSLHASTNELTMLVTNTSPAGPWIDTATPFLSPISFASLNMRRLTGVRSRNWFQANGTRASGARDTIGSVET